MAWVFYPLFPAVARRDFITGNKTMMQVNMTKTDKFKMPIPVLLGAAIFILLGLSVYAVFSLQELNIENDMQATLNGTHRMFHGQLYKEATFLRNLVLMNQDNENMQKAFLARDRRELLEITTPMLEDFALMDGVSHFYFHDLDRTCFVRVHHPRRYGDEITRYTLAEAERSGETSYGIELGPYGAFTLRVVSPWQIDGKIAGYIELGKEIDHIAPTLKKVMDVELLFAVRKEFLNRELLEESEAERVTAAGKIDWDHLPDHVMIESTMGGEPPLVSEKLQHNDEEHGGGEFFELDLGKRHFRGAFTPLLEVSGRDVGEFIILKDTTEAYVIYNRLTDIIMILFAVVSLVLLAVLYYLIREFEQGVLAMDERRSGGETAS